jgi:hypothetical protein
MRRGGTQAGTKLPRNSSGRSTGCRTVRRRRGAANEHERPQHFVVHAALDGVDANAAQLVLDPEYHLGFFDVLRGLGLPAFRDQGLRSDL